MYDVVPATREREPEIRAHCDRHAHVRSARDGDRGPDSDDLRFGPALKGAAACEKVTRSRRGRKHGHVVAEPAERSGRAGDVRVYFVRLRPRERRDEADAEAHSRASVAP